MDSRVQIVVATGTLIGFAIIIDLVRRRRLLERYALLWLLSAVVLVALAAWRGGLQVVADALGIAAPTNALFLVAFAFVLVLLLHFSVAVSRLSDQTKVLAQRLALAEERLAHAERAAAGEDPPVADAARERPSDVARSL